MASCGLQCLQPFQCEARCRHNEHIIAPHAHAAGLLAISSGAGAWAHRTDPRKGRVLCLRSLLSSYSACFARTLQRWSSKLRPLHHNAAQVQALLVIPKTLAVNAAKDATELVAKLRTYHNHAQKSDDKRYLSKARACFPACACLSTAHCHSVLTILTAPGYGSVVDIQRCGRTCMVLPGIASIADLLA